MSSTYLHGSEATVRMLRGHAHGGVDRWRGCGAVRGAGGSRVVLAAAPAQTNTRVSNGVTLHLVDGHLGSVALDELNETAALARRDLDVSDLTKALEERAKLVFGDVARKTTDENGSVIGIGELVHGLRSTVEAERGCAHAVHTDGATGHTTHTARSSVGVLVLGGGG